MNDQGVYSTAGGTSGPNIVSTDWTVLSTTELAASTSYTDATVSASSSYKYAVIHRDLAYNYSTALVSATITTPAAGGIADPTSFAQQTSNTTTTQVGLSATANASSNNIIVAFNITNSFGTPANGTPYAASASLPTAGTVIYNGSASGLASAPHTGRTDNTLYYYKAWSYDASTNYSSGVSTTGTTQTNISATATPTTITATTALTGGTIDAGGAATLTAKGTAWGTAAAPTTLVAASGVATGAFTQTLNPPLTAQTFYYVRPYATNAGGTNYGTDVTFRTLSLEPTAHPATLTATAASSSQINLSFSAASTITNAKGYILLRRTGSNPTGTNIVDGVAPTALTMPSGTTFVSDISSTSTTTYNNTGLPNPNTQYNYALIAYDWDGTNPETYNYYIGGTIKTANATTLCGSTTISYTQDFESVTTPAIPSCTTIQNAGSGNNWITASPAANGFTTKVLEYSFNSSNAANAWFYTQGLNLTSGTSYRLTFNYGNNASTTYIEKLKVAYGSTAVNTAMTNPLADYPSINDATIHTTTIDFTPATTGVFYIGFNCYSAADQ